LTPLASFYAAIPLSGAFVALFTVEQLVNGWRNGFEGTATSRRPDRRRASHRQSLTACQLVFYWSP